MKFKMEQAIFSKPTRKFNNVKEIQKVKSSNWEEEMFKRAPGKKL